MARMPLIALMTGLAGAAHATTFDFAAVPYDEAPLTLTADGLTATFASAQANQYQVLDSGFDGLGAFVLQNTLGGPADLSIGFSAAQGHISFAFATDETGTASLVTLTLFLRGAQVGQATASGAADSQGVPEGIISYDGPAFTSAVLSDPDAALAIGNVSVPEPASVALVAAGLGLLAARRRRA